MIKVQFRDGQTLSFDLYKESDRLAWNNFSSSDAWAKSITAMAISSKKTLHTLPVPNSGLVAFGFGAGLITGKPKKKVLGEVVWYCVDKVKVELVVYNTNQKVTKVRVSRLPIGPGV